MDEVRWDVREATRLEAHHPRRRQLEWQNPAAQRRTEHPGIADGALRYGLIPPRYERAAGLLREFADPTPRSLPPPPPLAPASWPPAPSALPQDNCSLPTQRPCAPAETPPRPFGCRFVELTHQWRGRVPRVARIPLR